MVLVSKNGLRWNECNRIVAVDDPRVTVTLERTADVESNSGFTEGDDLLEPVPNACKRRHGSAEAVSRDPQRDVFGEIHRG